MQFSKLVRNFLLWLLPAFLVWSAFTPSYNRFLTEATENLVQLTESPNHTTLRSYEKHHFLIYRNDLKGQTSTGHVYSVRITDTHFPVVLVLALFLAVPGVRLSKKLRALGWSFLILVFFHLLSLLFWVKFAYATQLGAWSGQNYTVFGQNFWGLGKHLLDLPFKFAMPLILWCAFFFDQLGVRSADD